MSNKEIKFEIAELKLKLLNTKLSNTKRAELMIALMALLDSAAARLED